MYVEPLVLSVDGDNAYTVLCRFDGREINYDFMLQDDGTGGRRIAEQDSSFYQDMSDGEPGLWIVQSILAFDHARQSGVLMPGSNAETVRPKSITAVNDRYTLFTYKVLFDVNGRDVAQVFTISGADPAVTINWEGNNHQATRTNIHWFVSHSDQAAKSLLESIVRFHMARSLPIPK
jgi:hypothetical protein